MKFGELDATGYDLDTGIEAWAGPVAENNRSRLTATGGNVYLNDFGTLTAIDAATGHQRWAAGTTGEHSYGPTAHDGALYHPAFFEGLYRVDPATGDISWHYEIDTGAGLSGTVQSTGSHILITTKSTSGPDGEAPRDPADHRLIALDPETGSQQWSLSLATSLDHGTNPDRAVAVGGDLSPTRDLESVAVHRTWPNTLDLVNASDGTTRWGIDAPHDANLRGTVVIGTATTYVATRTDDGTRTTVDAYTTKTGESLWSATHIHADTTSHGAFALTPLDGQLYLTATYVAVGNLDQNPGGTIIAIDPATGTTAWRHDTAQPATPPHQGPDGTLIVVTSDPDIGCD